MRQPEENTIKAWAEQYEAGPFCFFDEERSRVIAWSEDPAQIKSCLYAVLDRFPKEVEILLKIELGDQVGNSGWQRYSGDVSKSTLVEVIRNNEVFVFSHGMHQLCVRDSDTGEYVAFDEHGIFFIYSEGSGWIPLLASLGFEERYEEPIYGVEHFHHVSPQPELLEAKFVRELGLKLLNCDA